VNYFPFHLGDYAAHTGHLEPMEDLAYRRLLDVYYLREGPLPADIQATAKLVRMRSMSSDVESVLNEFFVLTDAGWTHARCEQEIERMQDKQAKARASAQASVNARKAKSLNGRSTDVDGSDNGRSTDAQDNQTDVELPTPTPTPIAIPSLSAAKLPTCPTQKIIALYHAALPELPTCKILGKTRDKALHKFWEWVFTAKRSDGQVRASTPEQAVEWIDAYFHRARDNDFLMGRLTQVGTHANWVCDLDFLLTEKGMKQVIEKTREAA
jgi:uncharacterized protein YdaU (DUF1376 family)